MSEVPPPPTPHDAYLRGVDALLEGRLDDAIRELVAAADAGHAEAVLALAKTHLQRGEGAQARGRIGTLLAEPPSDPGLHAYLLLLSASASALQGRTEEAMTALGDVARVDPRMEHAARSLRRRLEKARPPVIRF
ncbi:MAG: tetratricopeptide repeat protein [bacterium]